MTRGINVIIRIQTMRRLNSSTGRPVVVVVVASSNILIRTSSGARVYFNHHQSIVLLSRASTTMCPEEIDTPTQTGAAVQVFAIISAVMLASVPNFRQRSPSSVAATTFC